MVTSELEWFPYSDIFLIENAFFFLEKLAMGVACVLGGCM